MEIYSKINNLGVDSRTKHSSMFVFAHLRDFYKNLADIYPTDNDTIYFTFEPENWGKEVCLEIGYETMGFFSDLSDGQYTLTDLKGIQILKNMLKQAIID